MGIRSQFARRIGVLSACGGLLAAAALIGATAAQADLQVCNGTSNRVGVSIGYKDNDSNWVTEGWWNLPPHKCERLLRGTLTARFYYVYAIDYDTGGEWAGQAFMCTREKEYLIRGLDDCLARGYDRTGFKEVDTGTQQSWTIQLTEPSQQQQGQTRPNGSTIPILPGRQGPPTNPLLGNSTR